MCYNNTLFTLICLKYFTFFCKKKKKFFKKNKLIN